MKRKAFTAMSAQEFAAAVSALHSPTASAADRHAANAWLIDFAAASEAPQVCAALLAAPAGAAEPALVAAAGLLAEAGSRSGGAAQVSSVGPLLELYANPALTSRAALARLAAAAAYAAAGAAAADQLLTPAVAASLPPARHRRSLGAKRLGARPPTRDASRPVPAGSCCSCMRRLTRSPPRARWRSSRSSPQSRRRAQ